MKDQENRKENRRKNRDISPHSKYEISDEQKFLNKAKKQFKKKIADVRAEEAWDDWEDFEL